MDGIVPFGVERGTLHVDHGQFRAGYGLALRVTIDTQLAVHLETSREVVAGEIRSAMA